jgi:hypothetical protein
MWIMKEYITRVSKYGIKYLTLTLAERTENEKYTLRWAYGSMPRYSGDIYYRCPGGGDGRTVV